MFRVIGVLAGTILLLVVGAWAAGRMYRAPGPLLAHKVVVVPRAPLEELASLLRQEGVVGNPLALRLAAYATRNQGALKAGEFDFPERASLADVLAVLRAGKPVQHRLTIPEGLTAAQVALLFERAPALDGNTVVPAEGMLLPETYAYERGTTRAAVEERGTRAMARALDKAWATRLPDSAPLATPQDALILASIVERETSRPEERPHIAAVFLNRLRRGMKLQSDPTVVYGASGGLGVLDHGITRAELDDDNPYNTYRIAGLPPGPISMPGLASLKAVTQPWPGDDLYFVADGMGGHLFAKTEQDHARNVARWREIERQRLAKPN